MNTLTINTLNAIRNEQEATDTKWHKSKAALLAQIDGFTTAQLARALNMCPKVARNKVRRYAKAHGFDPVHAWNQDNIDTLEAIF